MIQVLRWAVVPWAGWASLVVLFGGGGPSGPRGVALLVALAAVGAAGWWKDQAWVALFVFCGLATLGFFAIQPSHDRHWSDDQARMPSVRWDGDRVTVGDLRTFRYDQTDVWTPAWDTQTFDLNTLVGADLGIEQFSSLEAVAHTFVSFRFADGRVLSVSVEIRKEKGESFSPLKGLFRQYEKMIVLGDERDLVELRAVHRDDVVYLYPMAVSVPQIRAFLESVLREAEQLHTRPAFYNTLTASCSSTLATHLRAMDVLAFDWRMYTPGYSDVLAWELGWLGEEPLHTLRSRHRINDRAAIAQGAADFSRAIRREGPVELATHETNEAPREEVPSGPTLEEWLPTAPVRDAPLVMELNGVTVGRALTFQQPVRVGDLLFGPVVQVFPDDELGWTLVGVLDAEAETSEGPFAKGEELSVWLDGRVRQFATTTPRIVGGIPCRSFVRMTRSGRVQSCILNAPYATEDLDFGAGDKLAFDELGRLVSAHLVSDRPFAAAGWIRVEAGQIVERLPGYEGD